LLAIEGPGLELFNYSLNNEWFLDVTGECVHILYRYR
jgi:hypothetical protein